MAREIWKMLCVVSISVVLCTCIGCGGGDEDTSHESASETSQNSDTVTSDTQTETAANIEAPATDAERVMVEYLDASEELARLFTFVTERLSAKQMGLRIQEQQRVLEDLGSRFGAADELDKTVAMEKYAARWATVQQKVSTESSRIGSDPELLSMLGDMLQPPTLE